MANLKPKSAIMAATTDLVYDQRVLRAANALLLAGWDVALVGRTKVDSLPLDVNGVETTRLDPGFSKGKWMYIAFNIKLLVYLLGRSESVFVANDMDTLPAVWLAARIKRKILVFDAHEYFSEVPEVIDRPGIRTVWKWLEGFLIPKTDLAYTVSESLARLFTSIYKKEFHLVRNLPSKSETFSSNPNNGIAERWIVYSGAINKGRALEHLVEALPSLPSEIKIKFCGDGDILPQLKAQVSHLGLEDRVVFTGYLKPDALRREVATGWLGYCCAEPLGTSYLLSLSNKFFEYMQAGIPQLMPPFAEFQKVNDEYGLGLAVEADSKELAYSIMRLLDDPILYDRFRAGAIKAAQVLNWENESQVLVGLYGGLL